MDSPSSQSNKPNISAKEQSSSSILTRWWMKVFLLVIHLILLGFVFFITPEGYEMQAGADTGWAYFVGTLVLWMLLFIAKKRSLILFFLGLMFVQIGFCTLFAFHYQSVDRILREINILATQQAKELQEQIEVYQLHRILEMLTPGNEFNSEELPELLKNAQSAKAKFPEMQIQSQKYLNEAVKIITEVSNRAAVNFQKGIDLVRPTYEQIGILTEEYIECIENLIAFLIDREGHYSIEDLDIKFDLEKDGDLYNQMMDRIDAIEVEMYSLFKKAQELEQNLGI